MSDHDSNLKALYITMAALAGSVTSLSFLPWKTMPWADRLLTVFVGSSFAAFAVPYLVGEVWNVDLNNLRAACFFTYIGGTGANAFIPILIRRGKVLLDRVFGAEKEDAA